MTVVDFDDTIFDYEHSRRPDEMDIIEEMPDEFQKSKLKRPSNSSKDSGSFKYPPTLDDEENAAPRRTQEKDGVHVDKKMKKVKKNRDFKDVEETGKWGSVSRKEKICVGALLFCVVVGLVLGLLWFLKGGEESDNVSAPPPKKDIVHEKFFLSQQEHYEYLIDMVRKNPVVAPTILYHFTQDVEELVGNDLYSEAAGWYFFGDLIPVKWERNVIPRFVLATTYIANGGDNWINNENWLSIQEVCDWYGVICDSAGTVIEVNLSANGLIGELHEAWALLDHTVSIMLNDNAITGPIPGRAFGSMASLHYLYLDNNQLTGMVPASLKDNTLLGTCAITVRVTDPK